MPVASLMRKALTGAGLALAVTACQSNSTTEAGADPAGTTAASPLTAGAWRGVLAAQGQQIPFLFDVATNGGQPTVTIRNGEERLQFEEITTAGDSTTIKLGVFDAALVVRTAGEGKLTGVWVKYDTDGPYRVPLTAEKGPDQVFPVAAGQKALSFDGTWKVEFKEDDGKTYPAVGVFKQTGSNVTGTFLTTTGDYRYLSGQVDGSTMRLSAFDGSHAYLFTGKKQGDTNTSISGDFHSGLTGHETWTATLDPTARLADANALSGMKSGQKKLSFSFPSVAGGGSISPTDAKYRGKVVVVQLLGSWCSNCMDETNFLAPWYEQNKQRGVEIIGLGYERATYDQPAAIERLRKMKQRLSVGYDLAYGGVGTGAAASASLPQLTQVMAFPTTIFLDKKGEVRKIHSGFSGPGTGQYYEQEKADFNKTIDQLLAE